MLLVLVNGIKHKNEEKPATNRVGPHGAAWILSGGLSGKIDQFSKVFGVELGHPDAINDVLWLPFFVKENFVDEIRVSVIKYPDRENLVLRYVDPLSGKTRCKSSGTDKRSEATKIAGQLENDLRAGAVQPSKVTWAAFRQRFENEVLANLAKATDTKVSGIFDSLERVLRPVWLRDLDANRLSYLQSELRKSGLSQATIKTHLTHIKAAIRWAVKIGWLRERQ